MKVSIFIVCSFCHRKRMAILIQNELLLYSDRDISDLQNKPKITTRSSVLDKKFTVEV